MVAEPETIGGYGRTIAEPETFRNFHEVLRKAGGCPQFPHELHEAGAQGLRQPTQSHQGGTQGLRRSAILLATLHRASFTLPPTSLATTTSLHLAHGLYWALWTVAVVYNALALPIRVA